jgi:hypothetical protein
MTAAEHHNYVPLGGSTFLGRELRARSRGIRKGIERGQRHGPAQLDLAPADGSRDGKLVQRADATGDEGAVMRVGRWQTPARGFGIDDADDDTPVRSLLCDGTPPTATQPSAAALWLIEC